MLYIKALVAVVVVGVGLRIDDEDRASQTDTLHSFEKQIMAQNKHGDGALESKPNAEFTADMKGLLDKMLNRVKKSHIAAQQSITTSFAAFGVCTGAFVSQNEQSSREEAVFKQTKLVHADCRVVEDGKWIEANECNKTETTIRGQYSKCTADLKKINKNRTTVCKSSALTDEEAWMESMVSHFTTTVNGFAQDKINCDKKGTELDTQTLACEAKTKARTDKQRTCDHSGAIMDSQACDAAKTSEIACADQDTCFASAKISYNLLKANVVKQESDWKVEYRLCKRVDCLLGALGDKTAGSAKKATLDGCIKKEHSTADVTINYPGIPTKALCQPLPLSPCTPEYELAVYKSLPEHAKGTCTPCPKATTKTTPAKKAFPLAMFSSSTIGDAQHLADTPRTFVAFVNVPSNYGTGRVGIMAGSYDNSNNIDWEIHSNGKPRIYWKAGAVDWTVNHDVRTGSWKHVAFVVNQAGTEAKCYVDGSLVESKSGTFASIVPSGTTLIGGDHRTGNTHSFKAQLKCVKIFSSELSASDIAQLASDDCQAVKATRL